MKQNRGTTSIVWGIIFGIAGGACLLFGNMADNDLERQWNSFWSSGKMDSTGKILFYIGIVLIVIGAILVITGLIKNASSSNSSDFLSNSAQTSRIVVDEANQLTEDEKTQLLNAIIETQNKVKFGIAIIIISNSARGTLGKIGYRYYKESNMEKSSCILVVNVSSLEMAISSFGRAQGFINTKNKKILCNSLLDYLRIKQYYNGYNQYVKNIENIVIGKKSTINQNTQNNASTQTSEKLSDNDTKPEFLIPYATPVTKNLSQQNIAEKEVDESSIAVESENRFCTNCGAVLTGAGKFCAECGSKAK